MSIFEVFKGADVFTKVLIGLAGPLVLFLAISLVANNMYQNSNTKPRPVPAAEAEE
ncbi:hypothetical protein [Phaeovulum veldkampii]|uniref:hypothetical protein n=1 Tax=Phaeovulum veldkampii TaxID=33049 RepID=UPI0010F1CBA2|nr:hypothetical protein [Phaeovulum veldkampii]TDQ63535.1 hypothetical protein EV658_102211 [Phaeovulum veldkampii DSM 11550]